jgi:hypothetical protein
MTITTSALTRAAGACAAAAGAIFVAVQIKHPAWTVQAFTESMSWQIRSIAKLVMCGLAIAGLTGMYLYQRKRTGDDDERGEDRVAGAVGRRGRRDGRAGRSGGRCGGSRGRAGRDRAPDDRIFPGARRQAQFEAPGSVFSPPPSGCAPRGRTICWPPLRRVWRRASAPSAASARADGSRPKKIRWTRAPPARARGWRRSDTSRTWSSKLVARPCDTARSTCRAESTTRSRRNSHDP